MLDPGDVRRWHAEAAALRREELRKMTPVERMEVAFRLFLITRERT